MMVVGFLIIKILIKFSHFQMLYKAYMKAKIPLGLTVQVNNLQTLYTVKALWLLYLC